MQHILTILDIKQLTHNVKRFTLSRPDGYSFKPGQATEVSLLKNGWENELRPFTFTSLPQDKNLEFTIKIYNDHDGVTNQLDRLKTGDELVIRDSWGTIEYTGSGVFLAGGAGITPFISIFRHLHKENKLGDNMLIFANNSVEDIILREEFEEMLGSRFKKVITQSPGVKSNDPNLTFLEGFIQTDYLKQFIDDIDQQFYVCGPPPFNDSVIQMLKEMGASPQSIVFEK